MKTSKLLKIMRGGIVYTAYLYDTKADVGGPCIALQWGGATYYACLGPASYASALPLKVNVSGTEYALQYQGYRSYVATITSEEYSTFTIPSNWVNPVLYSYIVIGGGGGGGGGAPMTGVTCTTFFAGGGGGGGAHGGGYAETPNLPLHPGDTISLIAGSGGGGGAGANGGAPGKDGATGGTSSFSINGTLYISALGGGGGKHGNGSSGSANGTGGAGGTGAPAVYANGVAGSGQYGGTGAKVNYVGELTYGDGGNGGNGAAAQANAQPSAGSSGTRGYVSIGLVYKVAV
jgi:hypothetical protein